jgi:hypothetical protein
MRSTRSSPALQRRQSRTAGTAPPPDVALRTLAAAVQAQVRAMDDAHRSTLFLRLRDDKKRDLTAEGTVFMPAAREALIDSATSNDVRTAARLFLTEWVTQPIVGTDPNLPAFASARDHALACRRARARDREPR